MFWASSALAVNPEATKAPQAGTSKTPKPCLHPEVQHLGDDADDDDDDREDDAAVGKDSGRDVEP